MNDSSTREQLRRTCSVIVEALVGVEFSEQWWSSPNRAFDNRTPDEQWALAPEVVFDYLTTHAFGEGLS
jgi:hypothetical protein